MPVTIVIGGQFGSEGKGKVAHFRADMNKAVAVVRCGGTNAGHTVIDSGGVKRVFRQLPTACILPDVVSVLCAGTYIDPGILYGERTGKACNRLLIDPFAVIITEEMRQSEKTNGWTSSISSTGSGTGAAVQARIGRSEKLMFAKDIIGLRGFITDAKRHLRTQLDKGHRIIIEGTQGFGLSLLHSPYYPCVTSRDTSAAGFLSEAGLSPFDVDDIAMVIRAFPIRVNGYMAGPLPNETTWEEVTAESGGVKPIIEHTSVTKRVRRVARFDPEIVKAAIRSNRPTTIFLNHVDYIAPDQRMEFVSGIENKIGRQIDYLGFSPAITVPRSALCHFVNNFKQFNF